MPATPQISIVFPTYKRPSEVILTLELLRKNLSLPWEAIILDNSPEPSGDFAAANVKCIFMDGNQGTFARNRGIAEASAPFLLMLDDDSHPLPGSVEAAVNLLRKSPAEIGGINSRVERLDASRENTPLLPTVFHGCGTLFRTELLKKLTPFYPDKFCFYGEEYWSTLRLYRSGSRLLYLDSFRVCHRFSSSGRSVAEILYRLTLNNRLTWPALTPPRYLEKVSYDTMRRYELICAKENVRESFSRAISEKLEASPADAVGPLSVAQFENFSLLSEFRRLVREGQLSTKAPLVLCGCGKFPTLWRAELLEMGLPEVDFGDFNTGLIGQAYGDSRVLGPDGILEKVQKGWQALCGQGARADALRWEEFFSQHGGPAPVRIIPL